KIWLGHMLESLDMIGNQKIRVAMFIMENINKENELIMTYRVIAEKTNTSLQTVSETMKALQESNLLSKIRNRYYRINTDDIFKVGRKEQMKVKKKNNILSKIRNRYYRVKPDVIFKGGRNDRMNVLLRYSKGE